MAMPLRQVHEEHRHQTPLWQKFLRHELPVWVGRYGSSHSSQSSPGRTLTTHSYAVIVLITRGQSRVRHAGTQVLRAGDVHLIPPGDPHGASDFEDVEGWGLAFHPEAFPSEEGWGSERGLRLGPLLRVRSGCHPVLKPSAAQRKRLESWLKLIEEELHQEARGQEEACAALLRLILVELERISSPPQVPEPASLSMARQALTYIEAHCLEPLSLSSVARALKRSSPHVASVVRQETGRTVGEWILEYRMAEARRRLRGTDERVDIIAERVGYSDVTHFIRQFRRLHGVTPAAWRRRAKSAASPYPQDMPSPYTVAAVQHRTELEQILALQRKNLKQALSEEEMRSQGFVTLRHDLTALEQMQALAPSVVAYQGSELVAYALMMPRECHALMPVLGPMFELFDRLEYRGKPLNAYRYYVMGQICIDKAHRGSGLFERLYHEHRKLYQEHFDFIITEVAVRNLRSMRAHERVGFQTIHTYKDATDEWAVVLWDWSQPGAR